MENNTSSNIPSWQNSLKLAAACPLCGYKFKKIEALVVEEHGNTHLFYFRCQKCQHAILNLVFSHQMGIGSMSLVTDLSFEEAIKFHEATPISIDDVLETHLWLENSDHKKLFNK
ncbi:TPA: hypothetical protein DEA21_04940 [Candidatus Uhrbacteria bacterium]|nr:hypothetical protein [Candidatus Uhrbacteria bacterium]HCU31900.1 hypothetical protein [Candidatus Uhrbacteria bacterium]